MKTNEQATSQSHSFPIASSEIDRWGNALAQSRSTLGRGRDPQSTEMRSAYQEAEGALKTLKKVARKFEGNGGGRGRKAKG